MPDSAPLALLIPHAAPDQKTARTVLIALRRIAAGGIDDASAANLLLGSFGMGYRRPLMFLRVLMQEISRVSRQPISIAPCCCPRMTEGEAAILLAIERGTAHPEVSRAALASITGTLDLSPTLSVAQALGDALSDLGRPISL
ncbi:DUF6628 family protein [Sphingomonas sp. SUN039]|uniref:DUF6628 family protein n=1 Tax=Sphingomonas sp. SUN039 TaxID=2937787 RepID=UPI002164914B|nr:DUF6628 family protein [Sphingomonas sp. SUN039]UVO52921.1 hypothetical protein M0209_01830 [Sphingomonas sp. SUN039]